VHSAKGLEFDIVFISGLEEGLFPHENSILEDKGLEEERRLMYVAVTRARERLYLSFAQTRMLHGQTRYNMKSRFLEEIPAGLSKWLTPRLKPQRVAEPAWGNRYYDPKPNYPKAPPVRTRYEVENSGGGYRVGQQVQHAKFGQGVIVNAEGAGSDARVQVNFGRQGIKWLALSVAKLTAA
ncbi:MAG: 3'-5' exonuclease, partial [Candidatus Methylophosphatis roskildensis]